MKKLINKIRRKPAPQESARITTETIAEHRERILAGGRRFKYPVQYARHRLVINAIIISVAVIILMVALTWWQLYSVQNTSDLMYRVTRVLPLPVASIDGQSVRYSDYLMKYRSSVHYLQEKERLNLNTEDGKRQSDFVKQQAMDDSLADAYAAKLARDLDITVTDAELETFLKLQRNSSDGEVSETTYDAVILDYYGWSPEEYRQAMESKLLRQKVSYAVDKPAEATMNATAEALKSTADLRAVAEAVNADSANEQVTFGALGWVPKSNQDGGLASAAAGLQKGGVSQAIKSTTGDGYYFIKLVDINDAQVNYEYIHIPLTEFTKQVADARGDNKVREFIDIPEVATNE
jgi:parvulin-like peptidyl-prolyl isomerase